MEEKDYGGRFRRDSDEIVVRENNFILHNPPSEKFLKKALEQMIEYANDKNDSGFVHPFIKATILHFWIAYLHPFCDGN
jgi:hypothetical protein|nr:MAG TPA: Fic family protein [Caudoviricetes sp.]